MENKPPSPKSSWVNAVSHPLRKFFGGVLATVLAGSIVYFVFNNPNKIKGRTTQQAWFDLLRYEEIYDENTILLTFNTPLNDVANIIEYKNDLLHQLQMISENFRNIREEGNIDNRLLTIINIKTDSYNQIKNLTEVFLDSLINLSSNFDFIFKNEEEQKQIVNKISEDYLGKRQHLFNRDTATINNLLNELTGYYTTSLYKYKFGKHLPGYQKKIEAVIEGKWSFWLGGYLSFRPDHSALFVDETDYKRRCNWQIKDDLLTLNTKDSVFRFNIKTITPRVLRLSTSSQTEVAAYKITE